MLALQAIGGGSFLLISAILSVRLILLALRNRALPELLLGLAFLLGGTLGALSEAAAATIGLEQGWDRAGPMLAFGKSIGMLGITCNLLFTWWVFRRRARWALPVIAVLVAAQLIALLGHASAGSFETGVIAPTWFWLELAARIVSPAWLGVEAFSYYARMRRRVGLGMADAVVANRFLLLSIASLSGTLFLLTSLPPIYLEEGSPLAALDLVAFAVFGLATAFTYWLAFFPPAAYRRWLETARSPADAG